MYSVECLERAVSQLFRDGVGDRGYTSEEVETMLHGLDFDALLQVVRHHATTAYAYTTQGEASTCFNYRGKELFDQRGTMLYQYTEQTCDGVAVVTHSYELWVLEDMDIVAVACVSINYEDGTYIAEYREVKDGDPWDSELYLDLEMLADELNDLCADFYEDNIPVYEL